jgi:hypothetical protein
MPVLERTAVAGIDADVPYIRSELDHVFVEFTARNLGPDIIGFKPVWMRNARAAAQPPSLEREGFQLAQSPSSVVRERLPELTADKAALETPQSLLDYWDETIPVVRDLIGAREVLPLHASTVRFSARADKKKHMTPAGWAHLDYDVDEAEVQLKETLAFHGRPVKPFSRYVLIQGWRALTPPPQDFPLAICDGRTVRSADMVPITYHMKTETRDVTYKSRGARHSDRHQWWFYPDMTPDEMLVFIGFDSASPNTTNTLHVAFEDRTAVDPVPRASVESRYFALFD